MSISSSVTAAWTETSSAETGSSATTTLALPAKARAMPMRCFCPPESWRGMRSAKARGSFTRSSSSSIRCLRSAALLPTPNFSSVRMICEPTEWLGFSVSNGFWNTIWIDETVSTSRSSMAVDWISLSPSMTLPELAVSSPSSTLARVDLPQPRFADDGHRLGLARLEAERLVGLDDAALAAAEDLAAADR